MKPADRWAEMHHGKPAFRMIPEWLGAVMASLIYTVITLAFFPDVPLGWRTLGGGLSGVIGGRIARRLAR